MTKLVKYHINNGITYITMCRTKKLNALSPEMSKDLLNAFNQAELDESEVIIFSSEGASFCAGGDIQTMSRMNNQEDIINWMESSSQVIRAIRESKKYVIVSTKGHVAGAGISLALASDFIIAHHSTKFTFSFAKIGLIPDWGLFKLLSERLPINIAKEWVSFAKTITADELLSKGIINKIVYNDFENLTVETNDFACELTNNSFLTNKYIKCIFNNIQSYDLNGTIDIENNIQTILLQSDFHKNKAAEFLEGK